ncbi:hypothetical protein SSBR45G_68830 [Bradyrhizobium sp. SSBR45G]|uniref:C13 family peptidase n=1 Tax=unclassified Bradyrhizobium TaxID=2631580 RepID=UPI002342A8D1|nr:MULTISPECIES: C13 family peptidase [unclassified Bradyrhizobium]GLH81974.1 hypothetical protein SSBR45G_68830 [Bradyrhizobium sp. SSBR45G]GLH89423.1 hypothetical protein SSBR45R_68840 [Bradyrhizobium sp. SSBR45R]
MNDVRQVLTATLKAAAWKAPQAATAVAPTTLLVSLLLAAAAQVGLEYALVGDDASFNMYGITSVIAETALLAAVALPFLAMNRGGAIAQLQVLTALGTLAATAAIAAPALSIGIMAVVIGVSYFSRHRTALLWKLVVLGGAVELALLAAGQQPAPLTSPWVKIAAAGAGLLALVVWWIGAVARTLGANLGPDRRPLLRALGLTVASGLALVLLPGQPAFLDDESDPSTYNLWAWVRSRSAAADAAPAPQPAGADIQLAQPLLMEAEAGKLLPERKGAVDVYTVGIAGWADENVFVKELDGGLAALDRAIGLDRGTIRLVNHAATTETTPIANRSNFAAAVHAIAKVMNKDEDVLLIFITSHGDATGVGLHLAGAVYTHLSPDHIATVLDREGIKNRMIIVSACYSGVFVKRLASSDSVVLTAADENNPSFGCSNEREWTYFGDALFNQNLTAGVSLEDAFDKARVRITEWEKRDGLSPSNPQGHFGTELAAKLHGRQIAKFSALSP